MERITNLRDLLVEQIKELYNAEHQEITALTDMVLKANAKELVLAMENHVAVTEKQISRLEKIIEQLQLSSTREHSEAMNGLVREGRELIRRTDEREAMDAAIIASIQYMKHFEIAGYGSACSFAEELGFKDIADQLHFSLKEEKEFDKDLTKLAREQINKKAKEPLIA
jgi:ferritin-like metal-binding protein YciE